MSDDAYIVIRQAPDALPGTVDPKWDGRWVDLSKLAAPTSRSHDYAGILGGNPNAVHAWATDLFEVGECGIVARVWHVGQQFDRASARTWKNAPPDPKV